MGYGWVAMAFIEKFDWFDNLSYNTPIYHKFVRKEIK